MAQLLSLTARPNPFHRFVCQGCGKVLGKHWVHRPDNFNQARGFNHKPTGKMYCHRDQCGHAQNYYQREIGNTMDPAYAREVVRV